MRRMLVDGPSRRGQHGSIRELAWSSWLLLSLAAAAPLAAADPGAAPTAEALPDAKPRNIILVLVDDHRFDALGFMGHPFLETPNLDRLAKGGVHLKNAFVTTALCSPSRASILTGQYAHNHRVVDNNNPVPDGTIFFPQYLQSAGYQTAFIGKWHMGNDEDSPRPGFHHWVSFKGQGHYPPHTSGLNVNGTRVPRKGYITDELTDYAVDWLNSLQADKPFFLYLSHKAVHAEFLPADRHRGRYKEAAVQPPVTQADTPENYHLKPRWVKDQRNSWHGVDFPYHSTLDIASYYRSYCETLLAVDDSVGRLLDALKAKGQLESTVVLYMGDNGFLFGEHGLIDKRCAYEESMRVPMLLHCPELVPSASVREQVVANIDVAPTLLEAAGLRTPKHMDGQSMLPILKDPAAGWRDGLLYEYYWERNFPQTPTMHALRTQQYKYIHYFGIWDIDELYDLQADPLERHNLIFSADHAKVREELNKALFAKLRASGGMYIPLYEDRGKPLNLREAQGGKPGDFPPELIIDKPENQPR